MTTWIQYHNCELEECYPTDSVQIGEIRTEEISLNHESKLSSVYTRKKKAAFESLNNELFLIIGIGKPREYYLWSKIVPFNVHSEDNEFYLVEGDTVYPEKPIRIDTIANFNDFKKFCGNFGIGYQNITNHPFSNILNLLIK
jgi:hypothetical protein